MPHIGEGELHAWLDGALDQLGGGPAAEVREHLRACAACREELVAEEAMRARATEVLALSAPRVLEAPPFETLLERARSHEDAPPARRVSRFARLGWAASIVVALGAGWMARDLGLEPTTEPDTLARAASPGPRTDAAAELDVAAAPPVATAPPSLEAIARDAVAASPESESRGGSVAQGATVGSAVANGFAQPDAPSRAMARAEPPPVALEARVAATEPAANAVREEALALGDVRARASGAVTLTRPEPVAAPARPPEAQRRETSRAGQRTVASAQSSASGVGLQQPGSDSVAGVPPLFTSRADPRSGAVSGIADADEALDLMVPGLEVLHVEWSQLASGQPSRRVLQRLATGDTLEIRFVRNVPRTEADPVATLVSQEPLPGWSQVVKPHRDGWLVARAAMPESELAALVARAGTIR